MNSVRVALPVHLQTLARVGGELELEVPVRPTVDAVLDALEETYPALRGTIRDHTSRKRRAFLRYFAAGSDISHEPTDVPLPESIACGSEVFCVIGAISGG